MTTEQDGSNEGDQYSMIGIVKRDAGFSAMEKAVRRRVQELDAKVIAQREDERER